MTAFTRRASLGALIGLAATGAQAQAQAQATIQAEAGWSRAAGAGRVGAGFLTLRNSGAAADRLVSARADIARVVELHTHLHEGGVMRMRPVEAIELPAGETVTLQPGGLHLMLIDLKQPLNQGERVPVTLVFERAGEVQVQLAVQSAGARGPAAAAGGGHRH
ncbi:copper chaperone PCu(A)C [Roseomonas sp. F4]